LESAPRQTRVLKFGVFEADLEAGELRKSGMRQKLTGQPFQVLQLLLERPQEIVTREELQKRVWPKDTFVDYDLALKKAVSRIREVLGDSPESPRFIETIPRRGYRFIGPVEELGNGVLVAAVRAAPTVDSIVVLPFTSMSADPEDEVFADGMTEEMINALAQIEQLHVVARSSAFSFKGKDIDPRTVGEQLNVRTILEGSVRRSDNRLRITVQLVNAADAYHLWSERYDREMKDIFDIQDEIARSVADRLKITLERGGREQLVKPKTKNLEAYLFYLRGRALLYRRGAIIARASERFEQAVTLDSSYALAWAGLADSNTVLAYWGLARPEATMPKALEAARRAIALDSSLAEGHSAMAMAALMGAWDKAEAEREFLCALELNPKYVQARDWFALFYLQFAAGRLEEGAAQAKLAVESDPLSGYANSVLGLTLTLAGRCMDGLQFAQSAVELDPESFLTRWIHHVVLHLCGRFEEAVAVGEEALAMSGRHPWAMYTLATAFADWGKPADAAALYSELMARARRGYVQPTCLALAAAAAGLENEAICHAREGLRIRDPLMPIVLDGNWPYSARLLAYPRFCEMLVRKGRSNRLRD
jgi:TolB-like protein